MPTLLDFRRRIRSVKNTQQITRAMKFVAAARLRRAPEKALAAPPYAREIANLVTELYKKEEIDAVYIVFSEFKSVISSNLTVEKLLPVEKMEAAGGESQTDYIYEQPVEKLLDRLLPRYVETTILRAMLESSAAEYAARMTAMESATKNAGEVIQRLTPHM